MDKRNDLLWAIPGEAALLFAVAGIGWASHQPLIFASLGPTAYEMVEKPLDKSAHPYNVVVGHYLATAAAFLSLFLLNAWHSPKVLPGGYVPGIRVGVIVLSAALTKLFLLILDAGQPAAHATALLVAMGTMQTLNDAVTIVIGVAIIAAVGAIIRHFRLKAMRRRC